MIFIFIFGLILTKNTNIMKKLFGILFVVGLVVALSSCKKDWTCECTMTDSATSTSTTTSYNINDVTKGDAESACTAYEISAGTVTYSCELK